MGPTPQDFLVVLRYRAGAEGRYPLPRGTTHTLWNTISVLQVDGHPRADWESNTHSKDDAAVNDIAALLS
jgi:hypothetical protein